MPQYTPPVRDTRFILEHVVGLDRYANLPGFANATPDVVDAVLDEGGKFVAEVLFPLNQSGDQRRLHPRTTTARSRRQRASRKPMTSSSRSGWGTLSAPAEFGGQEMPHVVSTAFQEYMISSNMAFAMYPGLTHGAIAALLVKGTDEQKAKYVPNMVSGKWGGTMNLTEPQCGTDLGLIRTRAEPQAGRLLFDHRHQDLHLVGRARPDREHHPSRPGQDAGRAGKLEGHLAVRGAQVPGQRRRIARRAQCGVVRLDRAQDGHPRQFDLRDEL